MSGPAAPYRASLTTRLAGGVDYFPMYVIPFGPPGDLFLISSHDDPWPPQAISTGQVDVTVTAATDSELTLLTFPESHIEGTDPSPTYTVHVHGGWV